MGAVAPGIVRLDGTHFERLRRQNASQRTNDRREPANLLHSANISDFAIFRRVTSAPANDSRKRLLMVGQLFGGELLERDALPAAKFGSIVTDPRELFTPPLTGPELLRFSHGARGNPNGAGANEEQRIDARGWRSALEMTTKRSISLSA